jgi:putative transcriptional regulator
MRHGFGGQRAEKLDPSYEPGMKNRIRVLRAERKWSQAELGERIGVSRNSVNAIENGRHDPSLPLAFRIAKQFGLPVDQVFEDES